MDSETLGEGQGPAIEQIEARAYRIPTDAPEADGTFAWHATTLVVAKIQAGGHTGMGYTYSDTSTATFVQDTLAGVLIGRDALGIPACWNAMQRAVRNLGRPGVASTAISALDVALWDLKGRILGLPVLHILGAARNSVPIYGSGGFTSYPIPLLREQLGGWREDGIRRVKMKVGTNPPNDPGRVCVAREAIGDDAELFVDANGAYSRKQALELAERFSADANVSWFEEPVSSDDLEGLRLLRDRGPAGMDIAAGEYGYDIYEFRRMLDAGAVDVLQADASRCGGITGFMKVAALCEAFNLPLSAHCAPSLHVAAGCAADNVRHLEYFHDHVRIEHMLFDAAPVPVFGSLSPDLTRPGLGFEFKQRDADPYLT
jgi:L-alanine-DL-glutamate epimerase-like enolase superfamily enzyme